MSARRLGLGFCTVLLGLAGPIGFLAASEPLVVHEWGTFTSLVDEQGRELAGINVDDEPVPGFVHNLNRFLLSQPFLTSEHWVYRSKGAPRHHPAVTLRLETPVIYFYPPTGQREPLRLDVSVRFRGGWLTEFYPHAHAETARLESGRFDFSMLTEKTTSSLAWNDLQVGTDGAGPKTDEHVWLAPRKVQAANVTNVEGDSERYLFYRGVGHLHAPLRANLDRDSGQVTLRANFGEVLKGSEVARIGQLWLVEVKSNGTSALRKLDGGNATADPAAKVTSASYRFEPSEFSAANRERLETHLHAALVADGLFADEATALLSTWQRAYFTSPGLRVFYLVPRVWTDHYLPLSISCDATIDRVMMGRLELISDEQRALLDRLSKTANSDGKWVEQIPESPARERFLSGHSNFGDLGVPIPADYQIYLKLGRFRNALVAHQERMAHTPNLTKFIDTYGLHPFRVPK
ncbi:MAG: hypothetical protein L0211_11430 [Planctomycetaceae bacterium]|nr:hypothetical protein [Planctomycetaceae bacterium]